MDRDVIARKLEQLRHHVARIESKKPFGIEVLAADEDLRDVVVFNLIQSVEVCVDVGMHIISESSSPPPETMSEVFDRLFELPALSREAVGATECVRAGLLRDYGIRSDSDFFARLAAGPRKPAGSTP